MMLRAAERVVVWSLVTLAACGAIACGGDDSKGPSSQPTPIRGGERLGWNQAASSVQTLRAYTFTLYVDGSRSGLGDTRCSETPTAAGYECSGRLPFLSAGQHTLELATVLAGAESPRSSPLIVSVTSAASSVSTIATPGADAQTTEAVPICTPSVCYEVQILARDVETPTSLVPTPDGRLFFVENGRRVRVIENRVLVPEAAIALPTNAQSRIVGLAADSQFARTHSLFMTWTEEDSSGEAHVNVTRYREVNNTFGEGAQIVTHLATRSNSMAPLGVDDAGHVYVALPGADPGSPFGGTVLRVDRDGLTPPGNPRSLPTVSAGFSEPTALVLDAGSRRFWIGGTSAGKPVLASVAIPSADTEPRSLEPVLADFGAKEALSGGLALASARTADRSSLLLATSAGLVQASTTERGLVGFEDLPLNQGLPIAVARALDGTWYVAVLTESGAGRIVTLRPVP